MFNKGSAQLSYQELTGFIGAAIPLLVEFWLECLPSDQLLMEGTANTQCMCVVLDVIYALLRRVVGLCRQEDKGA